MDDTVPFDNTQGRKNQNDGQTQTSTVPISPPQKELGPTGTETQLETISEKPEVPPELREVGVEEVSEEIEVPYEARRAGLSPSKAAVPPQTAPTGAVSIPLTGAKAMQILRIHKNVLDAIVWLAMWCLRQLKIIGQREGQD